MGNRSPYARVETPEKVVALTFDDGPCPANTPAVLELLARHQVKATFFILRGPTPAGSGSSGDMSSATGR
jgi:peptidoglycan/xylan/chitin deacetylase (PgdA/CDA1 family)